MENEAPHEAGKVRALENCDDEKLSLTWGP